MATLRNNDPPPLTWSDLGDVLNSQEGNDGREANRAKSLWFDADLYIRGLCNDLMQRAYIEGNRSLALMAIRSLRKSSESIDKLKEFRPQILAAWREAKSKVESRPDGGATAKRIPFDRLTPTNKAHVQDILNHAVRNSLYDLQNDDMKNC